MKKFWKYIAACAAAVMLLPLVACNDDDTVDPYDINYIYCYQKDNLYPSIEYRANGNFLENIDDPLQLVPVRLTKPAPADLTVEIAIDPSAVDEYNAANNTAYKPVTGAQLLTTTLTIAKGEYVSPEVISVSLADHSEFENNSDNLMLPIVIKSISASNVSISKSSRLFIAFNYSANFVSLKNISPVEVGNDQSTWATQLANVNITDFATSLWDAEEPINVNIDIDGTLVKAYNEANGTDYVFMSDATLKANTITIPTGAKTIDLGINVGDYSNMPEDGFIIPVRMTAVDGFGAAADDKANISYILICRRVPAIISGTPTGNVIAYNEDDGWTITVNGKDVYEDEEYGEEYEWTYLLGGYYVGPWEEGSTIVIDFGSPRTISGFVINFYAGFWQYGFNKLTSVKTSLDGNKWKNWGESEANWYLASKQYQFSYTTTVQQIEFTIGEGVGYGINPESLKFYEP